MKNKQAQLIQPKIEAKIEALLAGVDVVLVDRGNAKSVIFTPEINTPLRGARNDRLKD